GAVGVSLEQSKEGIHGCLLRPARFGRLESFEPLPPSRLRDSGRRFLLHRAELRLDRVIEASARLSTAGSFRTRGLADQGPMDQNTRGILISAALSPTGADMDPK